MWRGEFTLRRAAALAEHLPPGSAVWRVSHHDAEWPDDHYILAALFDRMGNRDSKPYPRPEDRRKQKSHDERAQIMAARFEAKQRRRAELRRTNT